MTPDSPEFRHLAREWYEENAIDPVFSAEEIEAAATAAIRPGVDLDGDAEEIERLMRFLIMDRAKDTSAPMRCGPSGANCANCANGPTRNTTLSRCSATGWCFYKHLDRQYCSEWRQLCMVST